MKNKSSIVEEACASPNYKNTRIQKPAYNEVERTLYQVFFDICVRNLSISGRMLPQQAKHAKHFAFVLRVEDPKQERAGCSGTRTATGLLERLWQAKALQLVWTA